MRICIVDDVQENAKYVARVLKDYDVRVFVQPTEVLSAWAMEPFDVIVTDQKMPGMTGIELVRALRARHSDFVAIVISAYTDSDDLIDAVNSNLLYKYVVKPFSPHVLLQHVHRAVEHLELRRANNRLQDQLRVQNRLLAEENRILRVGNQPIFDVFAGRNPGVKRVKELAQLYGASDAPVLITGETGTGKELLARAVHAFSARREQAFLPINCSAIQESLLESELFGYVKGAFTGADAKKPGLVETAAGGVLFLDEIGDLPLSLQPKLLRLIQFGTYIPVGATQEQQVDIRIISATNKNLRLEVSRGTFREDLYYRISSFQIHLPPLRKRPEDVPEILERIAAARGLTVPEMDDDAKRVLAEHPFPGNVRELQNVFDRLLVARRAPSAVDGRAITADAMAGAVRGTNQHEVDTPSEDTFSVAPNYLVQGPIPGETVDLQAELESARRTVIEGVMAQESGNITRTATRLGMSRQGLKNKLREYDEAEGTAQPTG